MSVENSYLIADDFSTNGVFPKAWITGKRKMSQREAAVEAAKDGNQNKNNIINVDRKVILSMKQSS